MSKNQSVSLALDHPAVSARFGWSADPPLVQRGMATGAQALQLAVVRVGLDPGDVVDDVGDGRIVAVEGERVLA
jgi:hypothetical protein